MEPLHLAPYRKAFTLEAGPDADAAMKADAEALHAELAALDRRRSEILILLAGLVADRHDGRADDDLAAIDRPDRHRRTSS